MEQIDCLNNFNDNHKDVTNICKNLTLCPLHMVDWK